MLVHNLREDGLLGKYRVVIVDPVQNAANVLKLEH